MFLFWWCRSVFFATGLARRYRSPARSGRARAPTVEQLENRHLPSSLAPKNLLIYYSYPSSINGTYAVAPAAAEFARYDYVVLGDGLEKTGHPDHQNTVDILAQPSMAQPQVFGYIDLGVSTQNLSLTEIQTRVDEWQATGASGIFFDDYGYDWGTARQRQNAAATYAHSRGMPVVANTWVPADAFDSRPDLVYNPSGDATALGASDFYLYESHQIIRGDFVGEMTWQSKANELAAYQAALGIRVFSVTTNDATGRYDEQKFFYAWYSALLYGHEATGWGEYLYAAPDGIAPFRTRPAVDPGSAFTGPVVRDGAWYTRDTDRGQVFVNTSTHEAGFRDGGGGGAGDNGMMGAPAVPEQERRVRAPAAYPAGDPIYPLAQPCPSSGGWRSPASEALISALLLHEAGVARLPDRGAADGDEFTLFVSFRSFRGFFIAEKHLTSLAPPLTFIKCA
jgi:hypothetical protein